MTKRTAFTPTRGHAEDEERYMDFLHYSFGFNGTSNNFPDFLPKVYKNKKSIESSWVIYDEDGYILSAVGAYPLDFSVCGRTLHGMGIGNVATHPRFRGFGYMKACMQASLDEMIEKDIDFGFLGGRRHRYRNFGYEKCSSDMNFSVSAKIMSYFPKDLEQTVTMIEVRESDDKILDDIFEAHRSRPYHAERPRERIFEIMSSWYSKILAFYREDALVGWAVSQKKDYVSEIVILDDTCTGNMLYQIVKRNGTQKFVVPSFEKYTLRALSKYTENVFAGSDACFMVLNYQRVLDAALALKASCTPLPDCELTVKINGIKKTEILRISVKDQKTSVCAVDGPFDYELSHAEAQEFLFLGYTPLRDGIPFAHSALLPLPLFMPHVDNV